MTNKYEPPWCQLYRKEIINKSRTTEIKGRTQSSKTGFYNTMEWKYIRDRRRLENPFCQRCETKGITKPMNVVNHIKPVEDFPELSLVYENTESLCDRCNIETTLNDQKERKKRQKMERGKQLMKVLSDPRGVVPK